MTESGPDTGSPCIFPFTYDDETYNQCLDFDDADEYIYENYEYLYYFATNYFDTNWNGTWFGKWCSTEVHVLYVYQNILHTSLHRWTVLVTM